MEKIFASPKKIPAHFLKKDGVESFDLWFNVLHKDFQMSKSEGDVDDAIDELEEVVEEFDLTESEWASVDDASDYLFEHKYKDKMKKSWADILKLTYRDGSVASMPNFKEFSDDMFQDTKSPKSQKGAIFQTKGGLVVIVRPHFNAQAGKYSRVGNHRDYPLKDVVLAIEQNMPSRGEHNSFVSAGKKNKEGEGNVDATLSYTIQKVTERATGSGLLNRKISGLLTEVYDDKELKDFAKANKVIVLNSAHGFKEWKKQSNKRTHNIWPDTWEGKKQFQDRQKRLGGKK